MPFELLAELLTAPFHSRSYSQLRHDAGLTSGVAHRLLQGREHGPSTVQAAFDQQRARDAITALFGLLGSLRDREVTEADGAAALPGY